METPEITLEKEAEVNKQITIVIPTLNEEKAIGKVIDELKSQGYTN